MKKCRLFIVFRLYFNQEEGRGVPLSVDYRMMRVGYRFVKSGYIFIAETIKYPRKGENGVCYAICT